MVKIPLVAEQIAAGKDLIREFNKHFPVKAAFWLRERESDEWYLYLVSDQINDANFADAYSAVLQIVPPASSLWLSPFQIKVLAGDAPAAKAATEVLSTYPGSLPTRYHGRGLGGLSVDEAIFYPSVPTPSL